MQFNMCMYNVVDNCLINERHHMTYRSYLPSHTHTTNCRTEGTKLLLTCTPFSKIQWPSSSIKQFNNCYVISSGH